MAPLHQKYMNEIAFYREKYHSMKVYVLGAGSMGSLVAHSMALSNPEISMVLLLKSQARLDNFVKNNSELSVTRQHGTIRQKVAAARVPLIKEDRSPAHIENLIVATKTHHTESALEPYLKNISASTNLLLLQNGMGMPEYLTSKFWRQGNRPNIFLAISTHGAYKSSPNEVNHTVNGSLVIAAQPETTSDGSESKSNSLVDAIVGTPDLNASHVDYSAFLFAQIDKLMANACINPLSAIYDCFNGDVLFSTHLMPMLKLIVSEARAVFLAEYKVLQNSPKTSAALDKERLLAHVVHMFELTSANSSSMREDVRHLNTTEVDWINGHIVLLGKKHKIHTPVNLMLTYMVKNKLAIERGLDQKAASVVV